MRAAIGAAVILATVALVSCSDPAPARLVEAKARASDSVHEPVPRLMRMACSELEEVDYDYWSLDARLPMGMLQAAWHQYDSPLLLSTTEEDCDLRWKHPADDVLALHFSDFVRSSILNTCKVWFSTIDAVGPVSWRDYADTLRPHRLTLAPEHRAELRRLDVNALSATVIYNEFDKDEAEILSFCEEAVQLRG